MRKSRHTQWTVNPSRAGSQGLILAMIFSGFSLAGLQAFAAKPNPICGNGICEQRESKSCPLDCADDPGEPPEPPPSTGVPSCGCSGAGLSPAQAKAGRSYVRDLKVNDPVSGEVTSPYEVRLPSSYDVNSPGGFPVLVYLHGWGGSFRSLPASAARHAKNNGYILVTPTGYGDGGRNSWNGYRSARLPVCALGDGYLASDCDAGPPELDSANGPSTCVDLDNAGHDYCYDSCRTLYGTGAEPGTCPVWDGSQGDNTWGAEYNGDYTCHWTTCRDSVGQIAALLDEIEALYCVDRSMIWVTGCSNGGMMVYELAKDARTRTRFAGFMPQVGAPHPGFRQYDPASELVDRPRHLLGFWGETDRTVPGRANFPGTSPQVALDTSFNGWLYVPASDIGYEWASMHDAAPLPVEEADAYARAYSNSLDCQVWQAQDEGETPGHASEVATCFFQGGHSCPGFGGMEAMMWDFAGRHAKTDADPAACSTSSP